MGIRRVLRRFEQDPARESVKSRGLSQVKSLVRVSGRCVLPAMILVQLVGFQFTGVSMVVGQDSSPTVFGPTARGNRLAYLDQPCEAYHVDHRFPKLITPQWVGEPGVDAVVIFAIDDMRDPERYETYLRPILDRLKARDGRAPVSVMTNSVDPAHPRLASWIAEGLTVDVHTIDHPCPCLQGGDFAKAKGTYENCVDQMASIAGNRVTTFRMPCCDSLNTPSPRFWSEIFAATTPNGNFLQADSSVFQIYTPDDPELPIERLTDEEGRSRFRKYVPFPSFVNTIRNYPYPYVIGRIGWQFPCMVPSDWEAQNLHQPNNPVTIEDLKVALDLTVLKQGTMNLVFHPHGWIRAEQIVELIDHADAVHGKRIQFLTFADALQRMDRNLLGGVPLRTDKGSDSGTRVLDLDHDGYLDVVQGGESGKTRRWNPENGSFDEFETPFRTRAALSPSQRHGLASASSVRFGVLQPDGRAWALGTVEPTEPPRLFRFGERGWESSEITAPWTVRTERERGAIPEVGLRGVFRDLDGNGVCEWLIDSAEGTRVYCLRDQSWERVAGSLPGGATLFPLDPAATDNGLRFIDFDADGRDDVIISDERRFGAYRFESLEALWSKTWMEGKRGEEPAIPMISRVGTSNGAWFHSGTLWVQNEDTARLPDLVERMSLEVPLNVADAERRNKGMPMARTPEAALASLRIRSGLEVELVAAEPLVTDPVAFDWDGEGRLWVVEMGDYPRGIDAAGTPGGKVRILTDENRDGIFDRSVVFLEGLPFPTGIKVWREGVFISTAPDLYWAVDEDGDGRADQRQVVLTGFAEGNQQHRVNSLRYGIDHRLYLANGDSGGTVTSIRTGQTLDIGGRDLWFDPETGEIGTTTGQTQFGRDRDDWQHWFGGNNANPMWHYVLDESYAVRNPQVRFPSLRHDLSDDPGAAPIHPLSPILARFNDLHMAGRITSACSPTIYRDSLLGEEFYGNSFVCEPVHNLIHREVVRRDGATWSSSRAEDEQHSEFLASDDTWFRPVMIRTGPDGALWIADMYRMVIEHPEWIPEDRQRELELRSGNDLGRIYRVVPKGNRPQMPRLADDEVEQTLQRLTSGNGWIRDMAQQHLLWERDDRALPGLRQLLEHEDPRTRLHALATLVAWQPEDEEAIQRALRDSHPEVRRWAARFAEQSQSGDTIAAVAAAASSEQEPVALLQFAATLGTWSDPKAVSALVTILRDQSRDPYVRAAALSSVRPDTVESLIETLAIDPAAPLRSDVADGLLRSAAAWVDESTFERWLVAWLPSDLDEPTLPFGAGRGWQALEAWRAQGRPFPSAANAWLERQRSWAREVLDDSSSESQQVRLALSLLTFGTTFDPEDVPRFVSRLTARTPIEIRDSVLEVLARLESVEVAEGIIERWRELSPQTRTGVVEILVTRPQWSESLIVALEQGEISTQELGPVAFDRLLRIARERFPERVDALMVAKPDPDRLRLVSHYLENLPSQGDTNRGKGLFQQHCANCHQLGGIGTALGPDLAALTNRTSPALLTAILDPNQAIEDKFLQYVAETEDGLQLAGVILEENSASILLGVADGKQVPLVRERLVGLESTRRSLMPEGLEAQLDPAAMADLLAFLRSDVKPAKRFPNNMPERVQADGLGVVRLPATKARIYGSTLILESTYDNLGWWSSPDDLVAWDFEIQQPGRYRVILDYASAEGSDGGRFEIATGLERIEGSVAATGTWDDYREQVVGEIALEAGMHELIMRGLGSIETALIDLRTIRLEPIAP